MSEVPAAILLSVAELAGQSPAQLRKRLGLPMSVLLRELHALAGAGLIEIRQTGRREGVFLADAGRALLAAVPPRPDEDRP